MLPKLILLAALAQTPTTEPTVVVHFGDNQSSVTMTVTMAEAIYKAALKEGNTPLLAALAAALGTRPCTPIEAEQGGATATAQVCQAQRKAGLL